MSYDDDTLCFKIWLCCWAANQDGGISNRGDAQTLLEGGILMNSHWQLS
jgi:hypothetical protein